MLHVEELDLLDGTPLLDIKPYVPPFDDRAGRALRLVRAARAERPQRARRRALRRADLTPRARPAARYESGVADATVIEARGLEKRYGDVEAVRGIDFEVARRRDVRLPRPERRRQVDDDQDPVHARAARPRARRTVAGFDVVPRARRPCAATSASCSRTRRSTTTSPPSRTSRFHAELYGVPRAVIAEPRLQQVLEMVGLWDRREQPRADVLGRHEAPARDRARPACTRRACCSSTSRRSGSIRRRASRSGATSASCGSARRSRSS